MVVEEVPSAELPLVLDESLLEPFVEPPLEPPPVEPPVEVVTPPVPVPVFEVEPLPDVLVVEPEPVEDVPEVELLLPALVADPPVERLELRASISGTSTFRFNRADSSSRP